jgi:hypothetical protein
MTHETSATNKRIGNDIPVIRTAAPAALPRPPKVARGCDPFGPPWRQRGQDMRAVPAHSHWRWSFCALNYFVACTVCVIYVNCRKCVIYRIVACTISRRLAECAVKSNRPFSLAQQTGALGICRSVAGQPKLDGKWKLVRGARNGGNLAFNLSEVHEIFGSPFDPQRRLASPNVQRVSATRMDFRNHHSFMPFVAKTFSRFSHRLCVRPKKPVSN